MPSSENKPATINAPPRETPSTEAVARQGRRCRLRRMIRSGSVSIAPRPIRSTQVLRKLPGGSARIASAGGSFTARRTAPRLPSPAATNAVSTAFRIVRRETRNSR